MTKFKGPIHMKYKRPITYHSKDMVNVKILKCRSNFKARRSKIILPIERSCHMEYINEISKPYHLPFKRYGQC
jgi:hypothetical protein